MLQEGSLTLFRAYRVGLVEAEDIAIRATFAIGLHLPCAAGAKRAQFRQGVRGAPRSDPCLRLRRHDRARAVITGAMAGGLHR